MMMNRLGWAMIVVDGVLGAAIFIGIAFVFGRALVGPMEHEFIQGHLRMGDEWFEEMVCRFGFHSILSFFLGYLGSACWRLRGSSTKTIPSSRICVLSLAISVLSVFLCNSERWMRYGMPDALAILLVGGLVLSWTTFFSWVAVRSSRPA